MQSGGIMIPQRHVLGQAQNPGFGSTSSGLLLGQHNLLDGTQQPFESNLVINTEGDMSTIRDDEFESKSGSDNNEGVSGDEQDPNPRPKKKKRYHRHTQRQIEVMEAFFKECPHPDDKQRKELSWELGLEPLQVKFWFQNKRTQMKAQQERHENSQLRAENDKLRTENLQYKDALSNASCPNCGGPATLGEMSFDEHQLRIENARLREEIDRILRLAAEYVPKAIGGSGSFSSFMSNVALPQRQSSLDLDVVQPGRVSEMLGTTGSLLRGVTGHSEMDKPMVVQLAVAAMEELLRMTQVGEPLWIPAIAREILNEEEYVRSFPRGIGPKPLGFKSEASRDSAVVIMNHVNLVEMLMDVNQWSTVFSGIVSKAVTVEVISTGVAGNFNGALQVMSAEIQVPTPLVPTRESYFLRYCKQHADGMWAVVDVSLDSLRPSPILRTRRRPSGCLIQEMPNGYSKVTWVEHVEVDDRSVHEIYKPLVNSGLAFGAKRWVTTLDRQCERFASVMASNISSVDIGGNDLCMLFSDYLYLLLGFGSLDDVQIPCK